MSYSIEILQKELDLINKALKKTKAWEYYLEAYKRQAKKVKDLEKSIKLLKSSRHETT